MLKRQIWRRWRRNRWKNNINTKRNGMESNKRDLKSNLIRLVVIFVLISVYGFAHFGTYHLVPRVCIDRAVGALLASQSIVYINTHMLYWYYNKIILIFDSTIWMWVGGNFSRNEFVYKILYLKKPPKHSNSKQILD